VIDNLMRAKGRRLQGRLVQRPFAAAWYWSTTLAGIRPRSLTAMPCSFAHAYLGAALPADRGPGSPARRSAASLAGVLDERHELRAEGAGVLTAQVDLISKIGGCQQMCLAALCRCQLGLLDT